MGFVASPFGLRLKIRPDQRISGQLFSVAALCALLLAACSTAGLRPVSGSAVTPRIETKGYYDELERYTWYESIYHDLDARIFLAIVWQSPAFRLKKVAAISDFRGLSPEEKDQLLASEEEDDQRYFDFVLSLFTANSRWNDLAEDDSIWRVELLTPDGGVVSPVSIERISRPDANLLALYPFINRFGQTYKIRFAALDPQGARIVPAGSPLLKLRLTSVVARAEPYWVLLPRAEPRSR